ncbi:S9 family peptidase [Parvularcula sp. ZS-1/3]|uniref:Acyl-peptide hydrolase n=1 Tax=Parvularcula mediterranea TaxID=2732508 RepID=A0A7Y3W5P0_9PROT|nr:S9 family peptidase [Parvularcula mediterranea]NNU16522.1 S9 family peptidase [Parvularcula mediterranea]
MALRIRHFLAVGAALIATAHADDAPIYPAEAFFETTSYQLARAGGAWDRRGEKLLISSDETGIFNVYALDAKTGDREALTESRDDAMFALGWMPDGESFLYAADQGGNELTHIYLKIPGERAIDLTPGDAVKANWLGWQEGKRAFFISTNERDPQTFDVYRYDVQSLERELIFENEMVLDNLTVGPKGKKVAGVLEVSAGRSEVYAADLRKRGGFIRRRNRSGADGPVLLTPEAGEISRSIYGFDPTGNKLVIGSNVDGEFEKAYEVRLFETERRELIDGGWDVSSVYYSPSGRFRVHSVNEDGRTVTTITDQQRNRPVTLPEGLPEGAMTNVRFSPREDMIAARISSSKSPADIYVFPVGDADAEPRQLTTALDERIEPEHLVAAEVIRYESADDLDIPAIQYRPKGAESFAKVPAVVFVHGGPGGQSRASYSAMIQHMVNNGYGVLAINNRGSSGYGKSFYHLDDRRHGEADLKDVVAARTYLESLDWVDGDKIAVMGGSYGGFMTMAALTFYPEVFDAGINIFGVTNWERTLASIPPWWGAFRERLYSEMGDPATDGARHRRISPLFRADKVTKPVLIVQGANDPRVLQIESDEMVAELRKNGVPVEYVLFPDEGHGFRKRKNRIEASEAYVRFLDQYLLGDVVPAN